MQTHFHRELDRLRDSLLSLSAEVERSIQDVEHALMDMNVEQARAVIVGDKIIDQHEVDIEEECLKILALYQPVARDLRTVIAVLKMTSDLERMGDLARNIGKYIIVISKGHPVDIPRAEFKAIFAETRQMVRDSLDAFVRSDVQLAHKVCEADNIVDNLNKDIIAIARAQMHAHPENLDTTLYLISMSRNLERIADYATNIAEDVTYTISGVIVRHANAAPKPI